MTNPLIKVQYLMNIQFYTQVFEPKKMTHKQDGSIAAVAVAFQVQDITGSGIVGNGMGAGDGMEVRVEVDGQQTVHNPKSAEFLLTNPGISEVQVHSTTPGKRIGTVSPS